MYHRLDFQGHRGTLKIETDLGRFRDFKLVAGSERDRSAIDTQSAKPGTMNTPAFSSTTAQFVVDGGASADKLVMMNKGTGNTAETKTSGKFLIYMKYLGAGPASLDTTV